MPEQLGLHCDYPDPDVFKREAAQLSAILRDESIGRRGLRAVVAMAGMGICKTFLRAESIHAGGIPAGQAFGVAAGELGTNVAATYIRDKG